MRFMRDPDTALRCKKKTGGYITILKNGIVAGHNGGLAWTYAEGLERQAEDVGLGTLVHLDGMVTTGGRK